MNIDTSKVLARHAPDDRILVSESGLNNRNDLFQLAQLGVSCFLIGESLMREENIMDATRKLLTNPWVPQVF